MRGIRDSAGTRSEISLGVERADLRGFPREARRGNSILASEGEYPVILVRLWRWINPTGEPSPETQEAVARNNAVTAMLNSDTEYWRSETAKLEADRAANAAHIARGPRN